MEEIKKSTGKHWLFFFVSLVAMIGLLVSPYGQWFWLILPIVCTEFAKAMDIM